jgi:molecular chaperone HtpG
MNSNDMEKDVQAIPFKAETRKVLDILVHSLYTEKEVFLRELISNASDALTRIHFEMLTNRDVIDPDAELAVWITMDPEQKLLIIRDTGIGMTRTELMENLGTIAHSGARAFLEAATVDQTHLSDIIGQFGVGFYSAFMVADWIRVETRSFQPDSQGLAWLSSGEDTYTIEPIDKPGRGTTITLKLKDDASEFLQDYRLSQVIKKHSDFVPYPIYIGADQKQANQITALWRQPPQKVEDHAYDEFFKQLTLEADPPLTRIHLSIDAPVQLYALLYIPSTADKNIFSMRKQDGLKLYARKVLIQEYNQELLPQSFRFVQGVVDSEDLPLNISRETIQSNRLMVQLNKLLTTKLVDHLKNLAHDQPEVYEKFWHSYGFYIKEAIATNFEIYENLLPLLRFKTMKQPDQIQSLEDYTQNMKAAQDKIYYIVGEDEQSILNSPHLELFRHNGYDVILFTDPVDSFMLLRLNQYKEFKLISAADQDVDLPELNKEDSTSTTGETSPDQADLIQRFKQQLGEKVSDVRTTNRLIESPARLVDKDGASASEMQRVFKLLNKEYKIPQRVLELNPTHEILKGLLKLSADDPLNAAFIDQVYENALWIEGLHPDPASMINRIQNIMKAALK